MARWKPAAVVGLTSLNSWACTSRGPLRQKWLVKRLSRLWYQDTLLRRAGCLHVNSRNEAHALRALGFRAPPRRDPGRGGHLPG